MLDRRERSEHRRVEDERVERLPALDYRRAQLADGLAVGEVERGDRRASSGRVDPVLHFLERLRRPGDEDDVRTLARQSFGGRGPDAAACSSHKRELAGERFRIRHEWGL